MPDVVKRTLLGLAVFRLDSFSLCVRWNLCADVVRPKVGDVWPRFNGRRDLVSTHAVFRVHLQKQDCVRNYWGAARRWLNLLGL